MNMIFYSNSLKKYKFSFFYNIVSKSHQIICCFSTSSIENKDVAQNPDQNSSKFSNLSTSNSLNNSDEYHEIIYCNRMITKHIRVNDIESAVKVFNKMQFKSVITWNSMLAGFSKRRGTLREARQLFDEIPERDVFSYNTMLSCYLRNSDVDGAKLLFKTMPVKDNASWNTMVSGFVENGLMEDAQRLFSAMPVRNEVSWNAMISGYAEIGNLNMAMKIFKLSPYKSVVAQTALITGCMKIGNVDVAEKMFEGVAKLKNVVSWNAMIAGYVENSRAGDAMKLFKKMVEFGMKPSPLTFTSVLLGCSNLSTLVLGKQIHQLVYKSPLRLDTTVGTSLLSMYCKCGVLDDAWKLFSEILRKDLVSWNSMISGFAAYGSSERALALFDKMKTEKIKPDWITFVEVLSACNHVGLVDRGIQYFESMEKDFGIKPNPQHYSCMVDLLGRAGKLDEAMNLIKKMPFEPNPTIFGSLLGASRIHKNIEVAEFAANTLLSIDPTNAAAYVQLANVYAVKNQWDNVSRVWQTMRRNNVVKTPGCSWIEIKGVVHEFRSSDKNHPDLRSIHEKLRELEIKMKMAGYVPDLDYVLRDVGDEQKQALLLWHSEKLAVAYGLMKVPISVPIRIFKNLRVCGDCHTAIKCISGIEGRDIIVRDNTRFHHFKDGNCSCGDYW